MAQVAALAPEAMVVAAYGRILPPALLRVPPLGALNIHPSLLPRHRGPSPVAAAVLAGEQTTGVTVMLIDEGMDTGPVLAQVEEAIRPEDTADTLTARLFRRGASLLAATLEPWARGEALPQPQDDAQASYTRPLRKEDGAMDFRQPAERLWLQVRAYVPWPGTHTTWAGRRLKLLDVVPLPSPGVRRPSRERSCRCRHRGRPPWASQRTMACSACSGSRSRGGSRWRSGTSWRAMRASSAHTCRAEEGNGRAGGAAADVPWPGRRPTRARCWAPAP